MAIVIKKRSGAVEQIVSQAVDPAEAELFCQKLAALDAMSISLQTEVEVAFYLGLGTKHAREQFVKGTYTVEWMKILPWESHHTMGQDVLPLGCTWEIHQMAVDGGYGGYATLQFPDGSNVDCTAKSPWAAFAVCLVKAAVLGKLAVKATDGV